MFYQVKEKVCHQIYRVVSNFVFKCRSNEYAKMIEKAAINNKEKLVKADEYDRIMSQKDELVSAVQALQIEHENSTKLVDEKELIIRPLLKLTPLNCP